MLIFSRKANNLFEKNAAPILHLAGVQITVVKVMFSISIGYLSGNSVSESVTEHDITSRDYISLYRQTMKARQKN